MTEVIGYYIQMMVERDTQPSLEGAWVSLRKNTIPTPEGLFNFIKIKES
jgi:hypothetical protein